MTDRIMKLNVDTNKVTTVNNVENGGKIGNGFTNAVQASNGFIYVLSIQNYALKIHPTTYKHEKINLFVDKETGCPNIAQHYNDLCEHKDDECLYAVPFNANKILKLHLNSSKVTSVGENLGHGLFQYSKSIMGNDGCVYGIPLDAPQVLRYNPKNNVVQKIGSEWKQADKWWCGTLAKNGDLYCAPYCSNRVLKVCISTWWTYKDHVQLRVLLDQGRASPRQLDNNSNVDGKEEEEKIQDLRSASCYRHFMMNSDDYLFRHVLEFL